MTGSTNVVRQGIVAKVGWLEFDRPPVNAFTREMVDEVYDALAAMLAEPQARVVVLASAVERYFSAGADLNVFKGMTGQGMRAWATRCHDIVRLLRNSPKPLLAAINGTAVGGGLEMTLHCDLRFAATDARLGQPEINIAFIPPIATTQALARLIGRPRAIRYLYEGTLVLRKKPCAGAWSTSWWHRPSCAPGCRPMARPWPQGRPLPSPPSGAPSPWAVA
jgi:enoyl-CoA hydratase/carnithine racemase